MKSLWCRRSSFCLLLLFCLPLYACGPSLVWQHPQMLGQTELQQATAECRKLSWQEANSTDYYTPYLYPRFPLYGRHYYRYSPFWYDDPPLYYAAQQRWLDEQRFFRICMLAKGWRQVPANPPR
jgi:hypothetical protein